MTFGIQCEGLLQRARRGDTTVHQQYIQLRMQIDKRNDENELREGVESGFVPYPSSTDVLIGRGRPYRDFPGNQPWNELIQSHLDRYRSSSSRFEKTCVTMDIVQLIRESKVRFLLEPTPLGWKVLDDKRAREKVAAALQNRVKSLARAGTS
jgi:hypothetical protein